MKRKILTLMLTAAMAVSFASGCTKNEKTADGGITKLTWIVPVSEQADSAAVLTEANKIIEEKIGANLEMVFIDPSSYSERMKMNMASENAYDLCFTSNWLNSYESAVESEGLMDITDYISDNLKSLIPDYVLDQAKIDGKLYAVPNIQVMTHPCSLRIQRSLAEKYNLDTSTIKSINDIEPFFAQVKAGEPDVYPFRPTWGEGPWTRPVYEEVYNNSNVLIRKDGTGKLVIDYETPEYQEAVKTLRDWYQKGYIRSDVASAGNDTAGWNARKYAADIATWKPGLEAIDKAQGYDYVYIPLHEPYMTRDGALQAMIGVGANSKNPEKAVELIELMNTDKDLYNLICYGIKDKHYTLDSENKITTIDNSGYAPGRDWVFGNQFNAYVSANADSDVWQKTEEMNENSIKSPLIGFTPDISSIRTELSQLSSVIDEYNYQMTGAYDPAEYWDDFVQKMETAGQKKVLEELQKQVDEFLASK